MHIMLVNSSTALIPPSGNQRWKPSVHPAKNRSMCNLWLLRRKISHICLHTETYLLGKHTHTHKLHSHPALSSQAKAARSRLWQVNFMNHNRVAWEESDLGSSLGSLGRRNDTQMLTFTLSLSIENTNPHTPLSSTLRTTSHQREGSAQQDRGGQSLGPDTLTAHGRAPQHSLTYWVWRGSGAVVFFFLLGKLERWTHVRKSDKRAENRGETRKLQKKQPSSCTSRWQPDNSPLNHENETMAWILARLFSCYKLKTGKYNMHFAAALFFNNDCSIWGFVSLLCASLRLSYALVRSDTALCSLQVKYLLHLLRIFQLQSSMFSTYFLIAFLLPYHGLSLEHYFHNITKWACYFPTCQ